MVGFSNAQAVTNSLKETYSLWCRFGNSYAIYNPADSSCKAKHIGVNGMEAQLQDCGQLGPGSARSAESGLDQTEL